jgi:hypothetical protein
MAEQRTVIHKTVPTHGPGRVKMAKRVNGKRRAKRKPPTPSQARADNNRHWDDILREMRAALETSLSFFNQILNEATKARRESTVNSLDRAVTYCRNVALAGRELCEKAKHDL